MAGEDKNSRRHFFAKKMANEAVSLLFTARSATSLKRRSLFFLATA